MEHIRRLAEQAILRDKTQQNPPGIPGAIHDSIHHRAKVRVTGFGRYYPVRGQYYAQDWSFRKLNQASSSRKRSSLVRHLPTIAEQLGVKEILAPSPVEFSGLICDPSTLNVVIPFGEVRILRGISADGCVLAPGQAIAWSIGGCAVGWISHPGYDPSGEYRLVAAAHMGYMSLERGVIPNLAKALGLGPRHLKDAYAGYAFPIDPLLYEHRWNHPSYGKQNKNRCHMLVERYGEGSIIGWRDPDKRRLGRIDLGHVMRSQFVELGIPRSHISGSPSYDSYVDAQKQPLWYTTRGPFGKRRNLGIITRFA